MPKSYYWILEDLYLFGPPQDDYGYYAKPCAVRLNRT